MKLMRPLCVLIMLWPIVCHAQSIPRRERVFNPSSYAVTQAPPGAAFDLITGAGRKTGQVWVEEWTNGLVIFGQVDGQVPAFGRYPLEFNSAAHVNVWLSFADSVPMPEIGWANRFGDTNCAQYDAELRPPPRVDCSRWAAQQTLYREQLRRLFMREWELAPSVSHENGASEAFDQVLNFAENSTRKGLAGLKPELFLSDPENGPFFQAQFGRDSGQFQVFLPWRALPPSPSLDLTKINVAVDIMVGTRITSSTAPNRKANEAAAFNHLTFIQPRKFSVTPCNYPLRGWFLPGSELQVSDVFDLENEISGYRYDPEGLSPIPVWTNYFTRPVGTGVICGPQLRYSANGNVRQSTHDIEATALATFPLPDGSFLLKSGPAQGTLHPLGVGACGACDVFRVSVFHLAPGKDIRLAFEDSLLFETPESDGDIQVSADWKTITVYRAKVDYTGGTVKVEWSSTKYCLSAAADEYAQCGPGPAGPPAEPRQIPPHGSR